MTRLGANPGSEWYIYDVGGSRSVVCEFLIFLLLTFVLIIWNSVNIGSHISMMVHYQLCKLACFTTHPDSVQAIIFLAPLAFNQVLEEDPRVNRLVRVFSFLFAI